MANSLQKDCKPSFNLKELFSTSSAAQLGTVWNQIPREHDEFHYKLLSKGWIHVGSGRHRSVYRRKNKKTVIKVSKNVAGVEANLIELYFANRGTSFIGGYNGITEIPIPNVLGHTRKGLLSILCVEWVERPENPWKLGRKFQWINFVDCDNGPQVGYTSSGRLVCFDWCEI